MATAGAENGAQETFTGGWSMAFPGRSARELWDIAADVESYPRFVPWCREARILRRDGNILKVDNVYGAGPLSVRFRTVAEFDPPTALAIRSHDGPFRHFLLAWSFQPTAGDGGCNVEARFEASLRSPVLQALMRVSWGEAERRIVAAFRRRVAELYGGE